MSRHRHTHSTVTCDNTPTRASHRPQPQRDTRAANPWEMGTCEKRETIEDSDLDALMEARAIFYCGSEVETSDYTVGEFLKARAREADRLFEVACAEVETNEAEINKPREAEGERPRGLSSLLKHLKSWGDVDGLGEEGELLREQLEGGARYYVEGEFKWREKREHADVWRAVIDALNALRVRWACRDRYRESLGNPTLKDLTPYSDLFPRDPAME